MGRIIGHLGLCRTAFEGKAIAASGGQASTIHIIDWLGSPDHRAVGMSLMRRAHQGTGPNLAWGSARRRSWSESGLVINSAALYRFTAGSFEPGTGFEPGGSILVERGLRLARDVMSRPAPDRLALG